MKTRRLGITALGLVLAMAAAVLAIGADEEEIKLSACPAAVQKTFRAESKGARINTVSKETENGETNYWTEVVIGGKTYGIGVAEDGTLNEISLQVDDDEIDLVACPAAVQKTLREEAEGSKIGGVKRESKLGLTLFVTLIEIRGKPYVTKVAEDGTLTEKTLLIEENEIELSACPAIIQNALKEESGGGKIEHVIKSAGIRKPVYVARARIIDKSYVIEIAEDGSLISKSRDEDD